MSLAQLKDFGERLGLNFDGLDNKKSAIFTRLMQSATAIETTDVLEN